jgi:hypothetical protein
MQGAAAHVRAALLQAATKRGINPPHARFGR